MILACTAIPVLKPLSYGHTTRVQLLLGAGDPFRQQGLSEATPRFEKMTSRSFDASLGEARIHHLARSIGDKSDIVPGVQE